MGFLDRLVADMVQQSTGFNARRIVRRVGGKNILLLGGAAVAGALLADKARSSSTGTVPEATTASPAMPLPPLPSSVSAPDLPPVPAAPVSELPPLPAGPAAVVEPAQDDQEASAEAQPLPRALVFAIVRTMVAAAMADAQLDPSEREAIERRLEESDLSDEQRAQVHRDLERPAAPEELAAELPPGEDPELLAQFAILILRADGELAFSERSWLAALGRALELSPIRLEQLLGELFDSGS